MDYAGMYFPNVETISQLMNDQYNVLRKKFPSLTIERHQVSFQLKTKQDRLILSTNIFTPLHHFSEGKWTLVMWREEICWDLILEGDVNLLKKNPDTINENPSSAEKEIYSAIC